MVLIRDPITGKVDERVLVEFLRDLGDGRILALNASERGDRANMLRYGRQFGVYQNGFLLSWSLRLSMPYKQEPLPFRGRNRWLFLSSANKGYQGMCI